MIEKVTLAAELEFGLETTDGQVVNYLQGEIASKVALEYAQRTGVINYFPTLKGELDASQLELTTDGYSMNTHKVASDLASYHYYLENFVSGRLSEFVKTQLVLSTRSVPVNWNYEPATSDSFPHYAIIDKKLRDIGLEYRRATNVRGVHVHVGTMNRTQGLAMLNKLFGSELDIWELLEGMYSPERISQIEMVLDGLGETSDYEICHQVENYNPGHCFIRHTKYDTIEFRQFDMGMQTKISSSVLYDKVFSFINKSLEILELN